MAHGSTLSELQQKVPTAFNALFSIDESQDTESQDTESQATGEQWDAVQASGMVTMCLGNNTRHCFGGGSWSAIGEFIRNAAVGPFNAKPHNPIESSELIEIID